MKTFILAWILLGAVYLQGELFVLNTISQTISRIELTSETVNNSFAVTGLYPNQMVMANGYIYLTNSGDNNIYKIDGESGTVSGTIVIENYSNPYDIVIHEGFAYVTGLLSNRVYKIDLASETVAAELTVGTAPQGLLIYNDHLYVANSGFQYPDYLPGELTIIDLPGFTVSSTLPVPVNPQRMIVDDYGSLHLVCTGNYADETGKIAVIDTAGHQITDIIPLTNYPINIVKTPGGRVYVGDSFGGGVFVYETPELGIIHDSGSLFSSGGSALAVYDQWLLIADAGTYSTNSVIRVYDFEEELVTTYQTAIGAIDITFSPEENTQAEEIIANSHSISVFPNPFRGSTIIDFHPGDSGRTSFSGDSFSGGEHQITIFNLKGQKVREIVTTENYVVWDGLDGSGNRSAAGIYLFKVNNNQGISSKGKLTLLR
jgi:DNA-binding beta-propeller fold protein YncE